MMISECLFCVLFLCYDEFGLCDITFVVSGLEEKPPTLTKFVLVLG